MSVLRDIHGHGGHPLFVGGWVRDFLLGKDSRDLDIEVFNLPLKQLRSLCRRHGHLITVGASFAVLKLTFSTGQVVDVSLPRRERQTGPGHRDFHIDADPLMTVEEAAKRRDLTVNAISYDPLADRILDPVNGVQDLKRKLIRHIGPRFSEDPLRVLRVYRFQAVLGFDVAPETRILCRKLCQSNALNTLPKERIEEELRKMILFGKKQNTLVALKNMTEDGVIRSLFPELQQLESVSQDKRFHSEGDVLIHTFLTTVEAADIARRDRMPQDTAWALCLAALIHDMGKADTTEHHSNGRITSYGHDKAGKQTAENFLKRLTGHLETRQIALVLAANHMRPLHLAKAENVTDSAFRRLAVALKPASITLLARLVEADTAASWRGDGSAPENAHVFLLQRAAELGVSHKPPAPLIQGRDLMYLAQKGEIPEGFSRGGPHFSDVIKKAYKAQLDGNLRNREEAYVFIKKVCSGRSDMCERAKDEE